jgi:hypothetical protein
MGRLASDRFAINGKPFENQRFLKCARRALAAIIGTERHQSAHSGTESPEKVPNYVLEAFTAKLRQQIAAGSTTKPPGADLGRLHSETLRCHSKDQPTRKGR